MAGKTTEKKTEKSAKKKKGDVDIHCPYHKLEDPSRLKPHPANPNRHPEAQIELLAKIIKEHGIRWPISVSKKSGFIVSGHGRMEAAIKLGLKRYPVVYQDFRSEAEELTVLVADNKIAELAETNGQAMADIIVELDQVNYPLELTALSPQEVEEYIVGPIESNPEDDIVPEPPKKAKTKLGDLYILGGKVKCPKCGKMNDL